MKALYIILIVVLFAIGVDAQKSPSWSVFVQQPGVYYTSERVTAYGYGFGAGGGVDWHKGFAARADVNLLWGNGNLMASRFAFGYQPKSKWSPGIYLTTTLLSGHKTEALDDNGGRPPALVWAVGVRVVPLYFDGSKGYASVLELGYGIGDDHGQYLEVTLLSVGLKL